MTGNTRRDFIATVSAAGLCALPLAAVQAAQSHPSLPGAEPWLAGLNGLHRQFFDCPILHDEMPLLRIGNFLDAYRDSYEIPESKLNAICGIHGGAVGLAVRSELWERYQLGKRSSTVDPATGAPAARNLFATGWLAPDSGSDISVKGLQNRGVRFIVCRKAIGKLSRDIAKEMSVSATTVSDEILNGLLPGIFSVPAMVVAVNRATESGLSYLFVG